MAYLEKMLDVLEERSINSASVIEYELNSVSYTFTLKEIIENYMKASDEAQEVFYLTFLKAIDTEQIPSFFEKMGKLLLMSSHSKEFIS
jgi:hypothetical protein